MRKTLNLVALFMFALPLTAQLPATRTVWDGAYSSAQAKRGETAYMASCAGCHMTDLSGKNAARGLKGPEFIERWREFDLEPLFTLIKTYMPRTGRKLTDAGYLDVVTYILERNGFPAGSDELKIDTLEKFLLVGKDGPKPPPETALIRSVGCMVQASETQWMIIDATAPLRTKDPDLITPQDVKQAETMNAGTRKYHLSRSDYVWDNLNPRDYLGKRILVKGYLIPQPGAERISLTALGIVAATCGLK